MRRALGALAVLVACATPEPDAGLDTEAPTDGPDRRRRRALVLGVDGLRPDALAAAATPHLDAMLAEGALAAHARTHATGVTLSGPGWASVLTGVEPEDHQVLSNDDLATREAAWPTVLERVRRAEHPTGVAAQWIGLHAILGTDDTDRRTTGEGLVVAEQGRAWVEEGVFDLVFVHLDDVDHAGHDSGFSPTNAAYLEAIEGVDDQVTALLAAVDARADREAWLVVLVTDHGGIGTGHGGRTEDETTIPVGMRAPVALDPGHDPSHLDVAPSVLRWLKVDGHDALDGHAWVP